MRDQTLYIFAGSREPDPYINSICHGIQNENVGEVFLIDIIIEPGKRKESELFLSKLTNKIYAQLDNLIKGQYQPSRTALVENVIDDIGKARYTEYQTVLPKDKLKHIIIIYSELKNNIFDIIETKKCLFDITPTFKNHLIDIYSIIIGANYRRIYYFELVKEKRSYDYTELIHNLTRGKTYKYDNITEGKYTKGQKLINEKINVEWIQKLEEETSHLFASRILTWILIIASVILFGLYKLTPKIKEKWDSLEPITFILFTLAIPIVLTYIFGSIYVAIYRKEPPKLNPFSLYSTLKKMKIDRLKK